MKQLYSPQLRPEFCWGEHLGNAFSAASERKPQRGRTACETETKQQQKIFRTACETETTQTTCETETKQIFKTACETETKQINIQNSL